MMAAEETLAGRTCPLRYRYGAKAIARAPEHQAETLYVVGGLYGNPYALDAIEAMVAQEAGPTTVCFNGDFNWFNVGDADFRAINQRVLAHHALSGNVEAELGVASDDAGCGCAYPAYVDSGIVERSNRIHARLKATAARHSDLTMQLAALPMVARYRVGDCRVGVVHGDAESLAGWRFGVRELAAPKNDEWLASAFDAAEVDVFASSHTCEPVLKLLERESGRGVVINNGAAGMPNFNGEMAGLITRIGLQPSPHPVWRGTQVGATHVQALSVAYDEHWVEHFLRSWPPGSDAYVSYFERITGRF